MSKPVKMWVIRTALGNCIYSSLNRTRKEAWRRFLDMDNFSTVGAVRSERRKWQRYGNKAVKVTVKEGW